MGTESVDKVRLGGVIITNLAKEGSATNEQSPH
jgi:hypothetical protein